MILAAGDGGSSALDGTWQLELERSTNPTALLERLDVGWLIKKAAPSARPTHVIVTGDERISIEVQSPLNTRKTTLVLDGRTTATDDFFGNGVEYTARREGDTIITPSRSPSRASRRRCSSVSSNESSQRAGAYVVTALSPAS